MKNPVVNNRSFAAIFSAITLALTLIGAVLRLINIYCNFEISAGYYYSSAILPDIMHIFFVLSVLALGVLSFVMAKRISLELIESESDPTAKVIPCFVAVAALVYIVAKTYFDVYFPMNSPNKILLHMVCLTAMFFFVTLARLLIGTLKTKSYLFYLSATVFLSGVYAIPSVFFCVISQIYRDYTYFYFDIIVLAVFIFATIKLIALITAKKPQITLDNAESIDPIFEETDSVPENTTEE